MISRRAVLGSSLVALAGLSACRYSAGLRMPEGTHSVGIEIFNNDSKLRDLEIELQAALASSIERLVPAPLVDPRKADVVLRGRIAEYVRRGGIRSSQNRLLESGVQITVETQLVRRNRMATDEPTPVPMGAYPAGIPPLGPGERVLRPLRLTQDFGYLKGAPLGESDARERTLQNLADRIVLDLFVGLEPAGRS